MADRNELAVKSVNVLPSLDTLVKKAMAQKKINIKEEDVKRLMCDLLKVVNYFNSIDEYTTMIFDGTLVADVKVMKEISDFIVPSAVKFDTTDLRAKDLALNEGIDKAPMSYGDYINLCDEIRGIFKKDATTDMVSLSELKKSVSLVSVIDRVSNQVGKEQKVNYGTQIYYPLRLDPITFLYEDRHFNALETDLLNDYMANFRFA